MLKVGIIIPYKEDRGWLHEAKQSVRNQTYRNIALIDSQSNRLSGCNFNDGVDIALNAGCDLIRYLCEDDMLTQDSVKLTVDYFRNNPGIDFVHGNAFSLYGDVYKYYSAPIKEPTLEQMIENNRIHGGTVTYKAEIFEDYQIDEDLWTGEEYDFNMMLMSEGKKIGYINHPLYIYRRHSAQKSLGNTSAEYQAKRKKAIESIKNRYK